jgi:HPt (histidine-containing phosphotransfer) domain-containing protein
METSMPILDPEALGALRDLASPDQPDFLKQLLTLFVDTAPARIQTIQSAAQAGDHSKVAKEAHSLKSSSANIGAARLSEICQNIEKAARSGDATSAQTWIALLQSVLDATLAEIRLLPEMSS